MAGDIKTLELIPTSPTHYSLPQRSFEHFGQYTPLARPTVVFRRRLTISSWYPQFLVYSSSHAAGTVLSSSKIPTAMHPPLPNRRLSVPCVCSCALLRQRLLTCDTARSSPSSSALTSSLLTSTRRRLSTSLTCPWTLLTPSHLVKSMSTPSQAARAPRSLTPVSQ